MRSLLGQVSRVTFSNSGDAIGPVSSIAFLIPGLLNLMMRTLTDRDIRQGFWYYRPEEGFPPPGIRDPAEYAGTPLGNVVCTETNLPRGERARLVHRWCELLPTLTGLRFLWFNSRVPQELFEAACRAPNLEGLSIKCSSIKNLEGLANSKSLAFLRLGSSPQLTSIEPLRQLGNLIWLELENIKRVRDLTVVGELRHLQGLSISGSMWTCQVVDSLAPLARLQKLRHLALPNLKSRDKTLAPICSLSSLEHFHAAAWWSEAELTKVRAANPKLSRPGDTMQATAGD